ncbi:hypothetical protein QZH41_011986, partial [Actinostola sp. cb2023]
MDRMCGNGQAAFVLEHGMNHFDYMNRTEKCSYDKEKMFQGSSEHLIGSHERRKEMADNYQSCNGISGHGWMFRLLFSQLFCSNQAASTSKDMFVDLPDVIDEAQQNIQNLGIPEHRIEFIKHDFTKPFPRDLQLQVDTVVFKNIMSMFIFDHDKVIEIFRNCRSVFHKKGGRMLIIDYCSLTLETQNT